MSLTAIAFLILFAVGCLAALVRRPIYGLYLYIADFYLHPPSRWWGAELPAIRWSLAAALVTILAIFIHRNNSARNYSWTESGIAKVLMLYVAWMWLQWPWVLSPLQLEGTILYTKYLLLFYLMYTLIESEEDLQSFCIAHVIGCAFLGWLIFVSPNTGRLESVGGPGIKNANTLGMHIGTGIIFAGFLLLTLKGWKRWGILVAIPFLVNGLFQTQTRGAFVGIFLAGIAAVLLKPRSINKRFYVAMIAGLVAGLYFASETLVSRLSTMEAAFDESAEWDNSAASRVAIASAQLEMFVDHPLGVGHQGTAHLSQDYIDERYLVQSTKKRSSHNTILTVLVDQGIPGIVLFVILAAMVLRILSRLKFLDRNGLPTTLGATRAMLGAALVSILGAGMFAQYFKAEVMIWTLALLAILWRLSGRFDPARPAVVEHAPEHRRSLTDSAEHGAVRKAESR